MPDNASGLGFLVLLRAAQAELSTQLRLDARLLQLELKAKASDALLLCAWVAVAALMALLGVVIATQGLVGVLVLYGAPWVIAPFVVAVAFLAGGGFSLAKASRAMAIWSLIPQQTIGQVRKDFETVREGFQNAAQG